MPAPDVRRRPPGRYDEPGLGRKMLTYLAASVLAIALIGLVFGLYQRRTASNLSYEVGGYEVISDTVVRVSFSISSGGKKTGLCRVRARNADGLEAGVEVIEVGPATNVTYLLTTTSRAVTGEVTGCRRTDAPQRP